MLGGMNLLLTAMIVLAAALPANSFAQVVVTETLLTTDSADQYLDDVDGNNAVFEDDRLGELNIWHPEFVISQTEPPAIDFTGGLGGPPDGDFVMGWEFIVNSPVEVISLGVWDEGGDGLANSHNVGLYTIGQGLLTSTNVSSGQIIPSASPDGSWVFRDIMPVVLNPGIYVVALTYATSDSDFLRFFTTATTLPEITFVTGRQETSSFLVFPTITTSLIDDGIFGPNLQVRAAPEPGVPLSLGSGLMLLGWLDRRRRRAVG